MDDMERYATELLIKLNGLLDDADNMLEKVEVGSTIFSYTYQTRKDLAKSIQDLNHTLSLYRAEVGCENNEEV